VNKAAVSWESSTNAILIFDFATMRSLFRLLFKAHTSLSFGDYELPFGWRNA